MNHGDQKKPEKIVITIRLPLKAVQELERRVLAAVKGTPGARFSKGAWCEQVLLKALGM